MKKKTNFSLESKIDIKEFKKLKESEKLFRKIFEEASAGIVHVSLNGNFILANQKFCDIVGYSRREVLKLTFQDITHPDDLEPDLDNVQRLLDKEIDTYSMEKRYISKNKTIIWINLSVSLVCDDTGAPEYFVAVVGDISERKQAQDKFELLVEQAGDAFFILDYDDAIIDVNEQACQSLGFSRLELLKMKISQVDIEVVDKHHKSEFWNSLDRGQYITFEGVHKRKDGSTFPVEVRLGRLDLKEKRFLLALARDITDRKRKEEELKKNIEFQQLIIRISTLFINLPVEEIDQTINDLFEEVGGYFNADRVTIGQLSEKGDVLAATHMWFSDRVNAEKLAADMKGATYPNFVNHLKSEDYWSFSDPDDFSHWHPERETIEKTEFKSGLTIKISFEDSILEIFVIDVLYSKRVWEDSTIGQVKLLGNIFSNALKRKHAEIEVQNGYAEIKGLKDQLLQENIYLREEINLHNNFDKIIGQSTSLIYVLKRVEQVAPTDATVLIEGETGTGKELFAHALHSVSKRKHQPLIKVGCASLSTTLIESEFFGHEKGAFTGADKQRIGRFELANKGSIFLDEIGELSLELQAKLLRVLQEGEIERLGSSKTIKIDVRVIAATNRNLEEEIAQGRFREDLYYRLNTFKLTIPPLRDRIDDISLLVRFFVEKLTKKLGKKIKSVPKASMRKLENYSWPGNIRELQNTIENAIIISENEILKVEMPGSSQLYQKGRMKLKDIEREHILQVLESTNWRLGGKRGAAELLDMKRTTLYAKMKKHGIERDS